MSHGGEAAHIETDLGDDHFGAERTHAGDAADELDSDAKGSEVRLDLPINRRDRCIETINLPEMELQQKAMMAGPAPTQGPLQPGCGDFPVPCASAASRTGSVSPATMALSIARPLLQSTSESSEVSLILASSSVLWMRWGCRLRS